MPVEKTFGNFFKPEMKSAGFRLFATDKVSISSGSDTSIQAYVRLSPPLRVTLTSPDIASETIDADCSCPAARKERLCKHVWATLLATEEKYPDFLSAKQSIDKSVAAPKPASPYDEKRELLRENAKLRAAAYRKEQYQKAKSRAKERKELRESQARSDRAFEPEPEQARPQDVSPLDLPPMTAEVEAALAYFAQNGFPLLPHLSELALTEAKRKLSRVFHPDRGGSHDEITELNRHCEAVAGWLGT